MKKIIFAILLFSLILCPAAMAGNFTNADTIKSGYVSDKYSETGTQINYDLSASAYAVTGIELIIYHRPSDTDFILTMLDGTTHIGNIAYTNLTAISCDITLTLDDNVKYWTYYAPGGIDILNVYLGTYATNTDTGELGILLAEEWVIMTDISNFVFSPDPNVGNSPIVSVDITASDEIFALIHYAAIEDVQNDIKDTGDGSILGYATRLLSFIGMTAGIIYSIMDGFITIFVMHFWEILVLYESVIIGYTAYNSRDLISWFKKFIDYNMKFFDFWLDFVNRIIDIFFKIIQGLIKWWS